MSRRTNRREGGSIKTLSIGAGLVAVLVILDQLLKSIMTAWLGPDEPSHRWELAGRYVAFHYVENRGAAFGILEGRTGLLIVLASIVAIGFVATMRNEIKRDRRTQIALGLIVAGAAGNLMDRIRLGYVVDFVAIGSWPKFNVADSCITIAIGLLAWTTLFSNPAAMSETKDHLRD